MKSAVAVLGMAAMANAYQNFPRHAAYHHQRADNYTAPTTSQAAAGSDYTTVTVLTTQVRTITSCAPTVTNCPAKQTAIDQLPADQKHVVYVTDTVVLTETVCPVSEAGKVSSSIIEQAQTGAITPQYTITTTPVQTATPAAPLSTGYSAPVTDSDSSGGENTSLTTLVSTQVTDKTLTLTIGTGTDAQVTTTTVRSTIETTVTVPCSQVTGQTGNDNSGVVPTSAPGKSYGEGSSVPAAEDEKTTTTTGTRTKTITLTKTEADTTQTKVAGGDNSANTNGGSGSYGTPTAESVPETTGGNSSSSNNDSGNGSSNGSSSGNGSSAEGTCECNGATATVTVTAAPSTVYVTVGTEATKTASYSSESTGTSSSGNDDDDEDDEDYCEDEDTTTTLQATVTVVPYPINGTTAVPTGYAKPSGFARLVR